MCTAIKTCHISLLPRLGDDQLSTSTRIFNQWHETAFILIIRVTVFPRFGLDLIQYYSLRVVISEFVKKSKDSISRVWQLYCKALLLLDSAVPQREVNWVWFNCKHNILSNLWFWVGDYNSVLGVVVKLLHSFHRGGLSSRRYMCLYLFLTSMDAPRMGSGHFGNRHLH